MLLDCFLALYLRFSIFRSLIESNLEIAGPGLSVYRSVFGAFILNKTFDIWLEGFYRSVVQSIYCDRVYDARWVPYVPGLHVLAMINFLCEEVVNKN